MNEKPEECNFCHSETENLEYYNHGEIWLCECCSGMYINDNQEYETLNILKSIAYCTNLILKEIRNNRCIPNKVIVNNLVKVESICYE